MMFDAAENVLGSGAVALLSNQSMAWNAGAQWWAGTADMDDSTYTRLQRVHVPAAAQKAIIGVASSDPAATLRALRLYTPELHAPQVLAGGGRRWGTRELVTQDAWTPGSIAAGSYETRDVALADCVPGDLVRVGYSVATTFPLDAYTAATGQVRARFVNPFGTSQTPPAGTLFVRAIKPRL